MTTRLAAELGISDESLLRLTRVADPQGATVLQHTWQGIQLLERTLLATQLVGLSGSSSSSQQSPAAAFNQPVLW